MNKKLLTLIFCISLPVLFSGCGSNNQNNSSNGKTGAIAFTLSWGAELPSEKLLESPAVAKDICQNYSIDTINASAVSAGQIVSTGTWSCGAHQGTISNVPVGTYTVTIDGLTGTTDLWHGQVTGITVVAGQTASAGTITMNYMGSNTYTVTYNGNGNSGGSVPIDSTNYKPGQTVTVLGNTGTLVNTGFSFSGWNTQANGSGTTYTQGQTFTMVLANVTLYAQWTVNPYTVTYNGNGNTGGSAPIDSNNYQQGQTVTVLGNTGTLVKTGYAFAGWNTQGTGSGTTYTPGQTFAMGAANVTLYAMWTQTDFWTWVSGANTADQLGSYGTKGVAAAGNRPGARQYSATWTDSSGQLWLFGGESSASSSSTYYFNDLWKFNGTYWTWVSGASIVNQFGTYGTKGVAAATNIPGARYGAVSWIDNSGNFWLFGGEGYDSTGAYGPYGLLNDLWKFDGTNWTWVSGANTANQIGTYGTKGVAAATNIPGAREGAVSWIDGSGQLWLFGGYGYDSAGSGNVLNDLWKFDGTNWIWVSGSNTSGQIGTYGTKGVAAATNVPGARDRAVSWIDRYGALWLFGGNGHDSTSSYGYLNDLWVFTVNGNYWIWKGGANTMNQTGTYGTKGVADAANIPGGRESAVSWTDSSGHFWLFSGHGYDSFNLNLSLNDLWKFDGTNWTWVSGASTGGQSGNYGTKGVADIANVPSGRYSAVSWTDGSGHFWLFGGWGKDGTGGFGYLNDLWSYQP